MSSSNTTVSIIVPIHNGSSWINRCFNAILEQTELDQLKIEVCVCNDASCDDTLEILHRWAEIFQENNIEMKIHNNSNGKPRGVGYAKNRAVKISTGQYLCFQDVDDVMLPKRIIEQYRTAVAEPHNTIIGSKFKRVPDNSTVRFTKWANSLNHEQLNFQVYTSHGPTIIMPTWFCHRSVFNKIGGFCETGAGTPEDLIFFYQHLDLGGKVCRADSCLLIYTYHLGAVTFTIDEQTIWNIRLERLQRVVLTNWQHFTIWNAGKQGRKLYNSLTPVNQDKVSALCDVDTKKIGRIYAPFDKTTRKFCKPVKIVDFREAIPPFIICVKMELTNGQFETNLNELNLTENSDYVVFS